jgi:carbonic anhydrase/acetyltransferase-like protein (isoleucine patch superfamily)
LEQGAWIAPSADVIGEVTLGEDVNVWYGAVIRGDVMPISVGARSNVQDLSLLHATSGVSRTTIGTDVTVGHRAVLHGCTIGNFCLIGMGAIVLDNVEIGDYCLIGAGALLTPGKKIPSGSVVLGSPGKIVREVTDAERRQFEESASHYVLLARQHAEG